MTTVVRRMVEALLEDGHGVVVVAPSYPDGTPPCKAPELRLPSVAFPPYPEIRVSYPDTGRVSRFLDAFSPDVVHVATEGPIGLVTRRYAMRQGIPLVTSYHTQFPKYARHYGAGFLEPLVWRWLEWFHGPARVTQTPGEDVRDELRAHGISQATVWGRGVDTRHFHPAKRHRAWKRRLDIDDDTAVVLHVGRLAPEKNLGVLAESWRIAEKALGRRAAFVIAGAGPRSGDLSDAVPFARRLGFLDRETLAGLYASSDMCVLPSDTETCGLVALEAMASGIPVIAANAGGLRESVSDGHNGLLVSPADYMGFAARIVDLAINTAKRRQMGVHARQTAELRDTKAENAELIRQYAQLAGIRTESVTAEASCAA